MSQFISGKISWTDHSSGDQDELGTEIDIYTDSPSFVPNVPVEPASGVSHAWMRLPAVAAGEVSAEFRLETPVTVIRTRVRQYNADGPGEWDVPAGTTFMLTQSSGPLAPPAVSAVGFVITDAVVVPPPPPPVEPPPPPPPTGGGGTSSNYTFTSQFSGVQGQNGWRYKDSSGAEMTYDSANAKWVGDELYLAIWNGGFRHSSSGTIKDAVLEWTAPADGTALVSGTTGLFSAPGNVRFIAKHEATTKFTSTDMTTTTPEPYSFSAVMLAGEKLTFISQRTSATLNNNNILLNPVINFTTDGTTPANPTVSTLSPSSIGVSVGGIEGLTVTLSSAPSSVATVSVSSSDPTKATVPASVSVPAGQTSANIPVTGVAAGSSTITATYNSSNKTASVTVSNPASSSWTNAPAGGTVLIDSAFDNITGFIDDYPTADSHIETISDAPFSPTKALVHRLAPLAPTGGGQLRKSSLPTRYREMYIGLRWRTNAQFQGRSVGNKLFFIRGAPPISNGVFLFHNAALVNGQGQMLFVPNTGGVANGHLLPNDDPGTPFWPNVGNGTLTRGVWHKLEAWIRCSTSRTARNGAVKWWINDNLVGYYEGINYCGPNGEFNDEICINETWDGAGDLGSVNTVTWEHVYDHCIVVGKN